MKETDAIRPLMLMQPAIKGFRHISEGGLPADFVDLGRFRNHPYFAKWHIVLLHAAMNGVDLREIKGWKGGWLKMRDTTLFSLDFIQRLPRLNYAVIAVTSRYRDRFFSWKPEIRNLKAWASEVIFIGHAHEYNGTIFQRMGCRWTPTKDFTEMAYLIQHARYFSGNQTAALAIRQGFGLPYRFEMSPNHSDTWQGSSHETVLNPLTRRLHLATIYGKRLLLDPKPETRD